ncbi:hypothetical protein ACLKA7_002653 [Drosophila subpalustris]
MRIRLHLVRFMYINLILSCCFWLYDIAAAADEISVNVDAAAEIANAAGGQRVGAQTPPDPLVADGKRSSNEKVPIVLNDNKKNVNQLEQSELVDDVMIPKNVPQQQQRQQQESFSEIITDLPSVTVTELPLQLELEPVKESLDTVMLQETPPNASNKSVREQEEQPPLGAKKVAQKDEINDPGGGLELEAMPTTESNATVDANVTGDGVESSSESEVAVGGNETVEEVPMPVFSEWAQKQMEAEASREQAMELEQQVVNNSAQRRNATGNGNGKLPSLKLRAKNYASPDCGAKIIASNADAQNTGAVLSHSSDEYMLSTCGSRIWFVVELCEAVQAQKVELANFELFSSSPRNFTVAVSKRFPTRDWSNVGRFAAEDKRTVQTFELHPHLFGKFVRVDIHSHYSKEHFCPISLFRVFGTSEFEAFETEIRHSDELDDFDDDFAGQEQAHKTSPSGNNNAGSGNIFQSASDAVMQMVKKAAQVLVKPTKALRWSTDSILCRTPAVGSYSCSTCNSTVVERINNLLSCQSQQLQLLLSLPQLRAHLLQTRVCQMDYDISLATISAPATSGMDKRQSFFLSLLPAEHVGAMCKILQAELTANTSVVHPVELQEQNPDAVEQHMDNVTTPDPSVEAAGEAIVHPLPNESLLEITSSLEKLSLEASAATENAGIVAGTEAQPTDASTVAPTPADVNIFNMPSESQEVTTSGTPLVAPDTPVLPPTTPVDAAEVEATPVPPSTVTTEAVNGDLLGSGNGMDDSHLANWDNIDSLLTTTVASITAGGGAAAAAAAVVNGNSHLSGTANGGGAAGGGVNLQPKLTHGAQSESVFIRLSNRIKALERNMSLSGQYLEELSRRYKKQVEELQQTLTQQTLTVRTLEDQSRRYMEQEQLYIQQSAELAGEVRALTYQVQACILVVIIVGTCIFLMLVLGTVYYRKLRRQTQQLHSQPSPGLNNNNKQNPNRRKSYEQIVEQSPGGKRRPSEEAMLIMNGSGDISVEEPSDVLSADNGRQRKISVCYGSNNNIAASMLNTRSSLHRRKGLKHASLDSAQEQSDKFFDVETLKSSKLPPKVPKKKSLPLLQPHELKRQESAPANFPQGVQVEESAQSDFDESLILDDEDLCNFIPTSDLAYNEFMPDGPSGYQIVDAVDGKTDKAQTAKKSRRVSSPAFFKSPFSRSKNKGGTFNGIGGVKGSHSAHEATSWEWYRLKRNEKQSKHLTGPNVSVSTNASLDSSSLSEINFPYNTTQNSFKILGEAILSSEESRPNGKNIAASAGSSTSSGASTTSSTAKKKQRAFNNIFRKVF